jgi:hypothetical protein
MASMREFGTVPAAFEQAIDSFREYLSLGAMSATGR